MEAADCSVYSPGSEKVAKVWADDGLEKVTVPGPEVEVHETGTGPPASEAEACRCRLAAGSGRVTAFWGGSLMVTVGAAKGS